MTTMGSGSPTEGLRMLSVRETRERLVQKLLAALEQAPDRARSELAQALEDFAEARGQLKYRYAKASSPLASFMFDAIEEGTDARLFAGQEPL
jgi:hypothetical protein